ncbi:MAG: hypothetical protein IT221_08300 [Fluviicola sp.]|nr:hypothetical protein [Fluviicola sp.]
MFFLFFIAFLFSCTKFGRTHTAKGRVMNPITGEGIPDVEMKLLKSTLGLPGGKKSVKEATSNSDGFFEISKSGLNVYYLQCNTSADYYELGWFENGHQISTAATDYKLKMGKTLHADFYAVPYGNYKIVLNNINCQGPNDSIIINQTNQVNSLLGVDWIQIGCSGFNSSFTKCPMGTIFTHYKVVRNGITNEFDVAFDVLPNQDNIQTINY